ncbi:hypothetical protein [Pseudoalteromonas gelatinilytica]
MKLMLTFITVIYSGSTLANIFEELFEAETTDNKVFCSNNHIAANSCLAGRWDRAKTTYLDEFFLDHQKEFKSDPSYESNKFKDHFKRFIATLKQAESNSEVCFNQYKKNGVKALLGEQCAQFFVDRRELFFSDITKNPLVWKVKQHFQKKQLTQDYTFEKSPICLDVANTFMLGFPQPQMKISIETFKRKDLIEFCNELPANMSKFFELSSELSSFTISDQIQPYKLAKTVSI